MKGMHVVQVRRLGWLLILAMVQSSGVCLAAAPPASPALAAAPVIAPKTPDELFSDGALHTLEIRVSADLLKLMDPAAARRAVKGKPDLATNIDLRAGPTSESFAYVRCQIELDGTVLGDVGLRYKGHFSYAASRTSVRRPMKLDFERFVDGQRLAGLSQLNLNNQAVDPSQAREALAFAFHRALEVPAPRTSFALVYLTVPGVHERQFLGLYTLIEEIDKRFLRQHFGRAGGLLMKPGGMRGLAYLGDAWAPYEAKLHPKDPPDPVLAQRMIDLARLTHQADDAAFRKDISGLLDVNGFLRYVAVNSALCNFDSFLSTGHNYYLYVSPTDRRVRIIPWDQNMTFGGYSWVGTEAQIADTRITHAYVDHNRLIERVLAIPEYHDAYLKQVRRLIDGPMSLTEVQKQLSTIDKHLRAAGAAAEKSGIPNSPTTRPAPYERVRAPDLLPFIELRVASLRAQLDKGHAGYFPTFGDPERVPAGWGHAVLPANAIMKAIDRNTDTNLSEAEFNSAIARAWPASLPPPKNLADPSADHPAITQAITALLPDNPQRPALAKAWSDWLFRQVDANRDARLTPAEFTVWFNKLRTRSDRDYDGQMASRTARITVVSGMPEREVTNACLIPAQPPANKLRPRRPPHIAIQFTPLQLLQMRRLGQQKELVDRANVHILHPPEVHPHAQMTKQKERLLAGHQPGRAQRAQRPADFVIQRHRSIIQKRLARAVFVFDDLRNHHMPEVGDDLFFALAQRRLIRDLIKIARGFGPFPIKPANRQLHVLGGAEDFFNFSRQFERGQMEHHAHADARADIGRAG